MSGEQRRSARKPPVKKRPLRIRIAPARSSCAMPIATWFGSGCVNHGGSGQPSIMWPIVPYISTASSAREATRRSPGVKRPGSASE